ncbi:MAG TPA: flagellar biosynthesis repressor FlbT [Syntrophales bacterium]|jgi:flagellar protein FlbT|nr:flagellar biosynthesis repressor FlbT [Syntrophales bacterium]HOX93406.1 flagellar biosynthesis repressor FlbT [Syntrophales bacterium]HPI56625.1 flagellar biosynthesis repressor FlbT [Syntrophales bacterium]HPN24949.1 flagellar biosynthesis repressor FlbT [Syntrophales bacterium]HQM29758.1 flagellar biosynthesis repressor FlbT [Syntrophales bacterium]
MGLKIELKPQERFIIGGAVVKNGDSRTELIIENRVPILREKDILSVDKADTPCKRIYFLLQLMYVEGKDLAEFQKTYWDLVRDVVKAAPSLIGFIDAISEHLISNRYYQALKVAKQLIKREEKLVHDAGKTTGSVPENP